MAAAPALKTAIATYPHTPINHTVVVRDARLEADPSLAPRLCRAFEGAKAAGLGQLDSRTDPESRALADRRRVVGDDPLPNGVIRNRPALEAVIRFAHAQKILPHPVKPEDIFAASALDL